MNPGKGSLNQMISFVVRGDMECLHEVEAEISRWRDILAVEYAQFLRGELILYPTVDLH